MNEEVGLLMLNSEWLEYLLNLFHQEYVAEAWEEIIKTKINMCDELERKIYSLYQETI